jgi:CheY-like chemotaxis protein
MSNSGLHVSRPAEGPGDLGTSGPVSVLLVEDDLPIRDSLGEALTEEGFDVSTAGNGAEALERLRSGRRPAVIVLDLMMPVMDGWDFRQQQLDDPVLRDIPVVVVSAVGFSGETIRMQFGDVAVFSKPIPYLDLLVVLRRACGPAASTVV